MTKYFKAEVTLSQTVTLNVAADSEAAARQQARALVIEKTPGAYVSQINLTFDGEVEFEVGTKIRHFLFGVGEILNLARANDAWNNFGFRATIKFENGDTKDIHLPMAKDKLEVIVT